MIESKTPSEKSVSVTLFSLKVFVHSYHERVSPTSANTFYEDISVRKPSNFGWITVLLAFTLPQPSKVAFATTKDLAVFGEY
jgi:hypothetical protein